MARTERHSSLPPSRIEQYSVVSTKRAEVFNDAVDAINRRVKREHSKVRIDIKSAGTVYESPYGSQTVKAGERGVRIVSTNEARRKAFWNEVQKLSKRKK